MIGRLFSLAALLTLLWCSIGCSYRQGLPPKVIEEVPPTPNPAQLDGTYAEHSPQEFGGSAWEMLAGERIDAEYVGPPGTVRVRIRALPGARLAVTRLFNGHETGRRDVPYRIENRYIRISRSYFSTILLFGYLEHDEVAVAGSGKEGLQIYRDWGYMVFLTFVPLPADTGPPLGWRRFPAIDPAAPYPEPEF